jgi:Holliday junction resolvase RusA-like endonuclease
MMEKPIKIVLQGTPISKARHRSFLMGKNIRMYDSQRKQKHSVSMEMMAQAGVLPFGDAKYFEVEFEFFFPMPHSWSTVKRFKMIDCYHTVKPDIDNIQKFYMDAANAILWKDDKSVCKISGIKVYGENPKTIITFIGKN